MNMSLDIDSFIRDQKSKIATERQYLSNQNLSYKRSDSDIKVDSFNKNTDNKEYKSNFFSDDNFVFKMREGENMKNRYKQELRNDFTNVTEYNKHVDSSPRRDKSINKKDMDGLLPGLGYSNSASKRKELIRNQEYNEFKKIEEENFRNRFKDKKNLDRIEFQSENELFFRRNPITADVVAVKKSNIDPVQSRKVTIATSTSPTRISPRDKNQIFDNKLDLLEKKVEDLRRFKIQDFRRDESMFPINSNNPYERPVMGKLNLRSLEDTENQLKQIDQKYDESKHRIMNSFRSRPKKIQSILDDEAVLATELLDKNTSGYQSDPTGRNNWTDPSIIPQGPVDEATAKRLKQDKYRHDLQQQMKEKSENSKRVEFRSNEDISFFDRFGGRDQRVRSLSRDRKSESARILPADGGMDKENDYFYYANRNPLDDYDNNHSGSYVPSSYTQTKPLVNTTYSNSYLLDIGSANNYDSYRPRNQSQKIDYGEELKRQIEERKIRKDIDKKRLEEYERKKNEEIMNYDPFGRGGGGAPLKDIRGETIANLKNYKFDSNITIPPSSFRPKSDYYQEPTKLVAPTDESKTYARGGHGIFGQGLTEQDKMKSERYKEELQIQIDIKKRQKEIERENERIREAKELEKLEKERKQIQLELENEKKIQMQKEIERTQRLEESRSSVKEKKVQEPEILKVEEIEYRPPLSPYQPRELPKPKSPVILREPTPLHVVRENSEITNKLHILRNEIKNRAAQVERELSRQNDDVEIFDPRLVGNMPVANQSNKEYNNTNVFQSVLDNKGPLSVRRGYFRNKNDAQKDKQKNTEAFLDEHLKQQEKILQRMHQNDFSPFELQMGKMNPRDLGLRPQSQMSNQLESDTNFIMFNQSREFPLKSSLSFVSDNDYPFLNGQSPKPFKINYELGSNTSLNIDELTRKNKQRLRKLQRTQHENESNRSPEEILNKIRSLDESDRYSTN